QRTGRRGRSSPLVVLRASTLARSSAFRDGDAPREIPGYLRAGDRRRSRRRPAGPGVLALARLRTASVTCVSPGMRRRTPAWALGGPALEVVGEQGAVRAGHRPLKARGGALAMLAPGARSWPAGWLVGSVRTFGQSGAPAASALVSWA